jgi:hypothetical protein
VLYGVILLWFILTTLSVAFVAIDIRTTPEATVMKWGFVLVTLFTGPFGAFLYVLGCREPLPGMHEAYVAARWRQVLGSAMHRGTPAAVAVCRLSLGVCARLLVRLGNFSGIVHARRDRRVVCALAEIDVHPRTYLDELLNGRNDGGHDDRQDERSRRHESVLASVLVHH